MEKADIKGLRVVLILPQTCFKNHWNETVPSKEAFANWLRFDVRTCRVTDWQQPATLSQCLEMSRCEHSGETDAKMRCQKEEIFLPD